MQGTPIPTADQIGAQPSNALLSAIAALSANGLVQRTGAGSAASFPVSTVAFTPVIVGASTAGTGTYTVQQGTAVRLGNLVIAFPRIIWTAHNGTGAMRVAGLPFGISSNVWERGTMTIGAYTLTVPTNHTASIIGIVSTDIMQVGSCPVAGGAFSNLSVQSTGTIQGTFIYLAE